MTAMDREKATVELEKKLDPAHVSPPKQYGPKGDYIESWHAISEANRIFGHFEWTAVNTRLECVSEKPRPIGRDKKDGWGVTYICTREITVDGVKRQGTGAGHGYDLDLGLAHESATKEAESDAEKRALRTFGNPFGLALYDKSRANVGAPDQAPADREAAEAYVSLSLKVINNMQGPRENAIQWWKDEAEHRRKAGLTKEDERQITDALGVKFPAEEAA